MVLTWKERVGERLAEFPLLRTLFFNPWFTLVFVSVLVLGGTSLVCLPKLWRSTPAEFRPVVRVSLLDLMQAHALRTAAERHAAQGNDRKAALAWQGAVANNLGNLEMFRGALRHLERAPRLPLPLVSRVLANAGWMLRLGETNRADVILVALVLDKYDLSEEVYELLAPIESGLSLELERAYLRSLFAVGRYTEFRDRMETVGRQFAGDPVMELHRAAYAAGWGEASAAEANLRRLKAAMPDRDHGAEAGRLLMAVSLQRLDPALFALVLERDREALQERVWDQVRYWRLLEAVGRKAEARRLAREYNRPPLFSSDVVLMAEALRLLELDDECLAYLRQYARDFGGANNRWSAALWGSYADLLVARQDWVALKEVATMMRSILGGHEVLAGYSLFVEGQAALGLGATDAARAAFAEAITYGFPLGRLDLHVARTLLKSGFPDLTLRLLSPLESSLGEHPEYWGLVFGASYALKEDDVLLLKAAKRAFELEPDSLEWQCNYAAALLIGHWRPETALPMTFSFLARHPDSVVAQINHLVALIQNGRTEEAARLLERVDSTRLPGEGAGTYHLAAAAVNQALEHETAARQHLLALETQRLFPSQRRWAEELRRSLR